MELIDPGRFYTLWQIVQNGLIPGVNTIGTARRLVLTDAATNNILRAARVTRGFKGVKYQIKGENIIKFLADLDDKKEGKI